MVTMLGQESIVHFGPRDNPTRDKYWAERGLIHVEDTVTGHYESLTVREFLQRVKGVSDMLGNSRAENIASGFAHADELTRQQTFIEKAVELAKLAKEQGMPSDPQARAEAKRRASRSVVMPSNRYTF